MSVELDGTPYQFGLLDRCDKAASLMAAKHADDAYLFACFRAVSAGIRREIDRRHVASTVRPGKIRIELPQPHNIPRLRGAIEAIRLAAGIPDRDFWTDLSADLAMFDAETEGDPS